MRNFIEALARHYHDMKLIRKGKIKLHPLSTGNLGDDGKWIDAESAKKRILKENKNE